jgi:hypothetical protein
VNHDTLSAISDKKSLSLFKAVVLSDNDYDQDRDQLEELEEKIGEATINDVF